MVKIPVMVDIASEFRYRNPLVNKNTLAIFISQSGETAETIAALRLANEKGAKTISVVNVKGSSIARESDYVLYTHAGPEIAVASTKAYSVQLAAMYLLAFKMAEARKTIPESEIKELVKLLKKTVSDVTKLLKYDSQIESISTMLHKASNLFFIGRGLDYALSCEGSIKLKEIRLPLGLKTIGNYSFLRCQSLEEIILSDSYLSRILCMIFISLQIMLLAS